MIKYSFVIPVYQTYEFLEKCVDSILSQSFKNFEIILIDDGSFDGSDQVCDLYVKKDSRVKTVHKINEGQGVARNLGVSMASGEFIIFIDSDDWWDDEKALEKIDNLSNDADIISFGLKTMGSIEKKLEIFNILNTEYKDGQAFILDVLKGNPSFPWYPVLYAFKKSIWKTNNISFPSHTFFEDTATVYKIFLYAKKVKVLPEFFYCYRQSRQTSTTKHIDLRLLTNHIDVSNKCIDFIKNLRIDNNVLEKYLLNNFACGYIDVMNFISKLSKNDYKLMKEKMKKNISMTKYVKYGKQKYMAIFVRIFGIDISSIVFGKIHDIRSN